MRRFILLIILAGLLHHSCKDKLKSINTKFGINQNIIRKKNHLVIIDSSFKFTEDPSEPGNHFIFINKHESDISTPEFLRKSILLDLSRQNISCEEDYYKNPVVKKYLIVNHNFFTDSTQITLQNISESISNKSIILSDHQADSILKNWRIKQNPF